MLLPRELGWDLEESVMVAARGQNRANLWVYACAF